jgi:IS30 family transposase
MEYKQLTRKQRYQIKALMQAKLTKKKIAAIVGVHPSSVSREIRRNSSDGVYEPNRAHKVTRMRRRSKGKKRIPEHIWPKVAEGLGKDWSPEQISNRLRMEGVGMVSHESIYAFVEADRKAGGELHRKLRRFGKKRKRYGKKSYRKSIPGRRWIDERPEIADLRGRIGDWEIDLIVGHDRMQALVSMVDRRARICLLAKVDRKTASQVTEACCRRLAPLKPFVRTITSDNGREFSDHRKIADRLGADFYFAHPHHAWERGTNENTNGLVRQYFPKGSSFENITEKDLRRVESALNNRPRKTLGYLTPNEFVFKELKIALSI